MLDAGRSSPRSAALIPIGSGTVIEPQAAANRCSLGPISQRYLGGACRNVGAAARAVTKRRHLFMGADDPVAHKQADDLTCPDPHRQCQESRDDSVGAGDPSPPRMGFTKAFAEATTSSTLAWETRSPRACGSTGRRSERRIRPFLLRDSTDCNTQAAPRCANGCVSPRARRFESSAPTVASHDLFERGESRVRTSRHAVPRASSRATSLLPIRPRATACRAVCSTSSGATFARRPSTGIRRGDVTGTLPTQACSRSATPAW